MASTLGLSNRDDCRMLDSTEAIRYFSAELPQDSAALVPDANAHELTAQELAALEGFFGESPLEWTLWVSQLGGLDCKPGDHLTRADGSVWHVQRAVLDDLRIAWHLVTTKDR